MLQIIKSDNIADQVGFLVRSGAEKWVEAGKLLIIQKEQIGHGKWLRWLEENKETLGFGESTAQRLMQVASNPQLTGDFDLWWNQKKIRGTQGTGENEWYTPTQYVELARTVLGDIDLDPASSDKANEVVGARKYFTAADNGLTKQWNGRVWLNPPYAQPLIWQFVEKMVEERSTGRVASGIMLTHNYTDTSWFHKAIEIADAICFTRGRIKFLDSEGNDCAPTQGQAFFYYGDDTDKFAETFLSVGFVAVPR